MPASWGVTNYFRVARNLPQFLPIRPDLTLTIGILKKKKPFKMSKPRPKHLDLIKIRFPVTAIVSGMHRISGTVLFLFIPLLLWLLQQSLATPESFEAFRSAVTSPLLKLVLLGLLWAYLHHLCAGIRHLALDLDCGTDLGPARATSKAVLIVSIGLTLVAGALLW